VQVYKAFYLSHKGYKYIPKKIRYLNKLILGQIIKVNKSDYIKYSRFILRKLHRATCYGKGSMYEENVVAGLPDRGISKEVLVALVKQAICCKKKKGHGWKYYLNMERYDKIKEIIKETGKDSIIPVLLML